ncbi:NUDIX domain-containing protein [Candidatus Woesearchaeota archaeon]|nr:NUDIX domain-containing protein [Candidatus Woesearchaeota archaeon]
MERLGLAVKSFIVNDKKELLLIKRQDNEVHCPGAWEIPGGRLELGENPLDALRRETKEETNLEIEILNPLRVNHFTRDDGQAITMISFLCRPRSNSVMLSKEHTDYKWIELDKVLSSIHKAFHKDVELFKKNFLKSK